MLKTIEMIYYLFVCVYLFVKITTDIARVIQILILFSILFIQDIVQKRGVPERAITAHNGIEEIIPAGINLGGDGILVLPTSVL